MILDTEPAIEDVDALRVRLMLLTVEPVHVKRLAAKPFEVDLETEPPEAAVELLKGFVVNLVVVPAIAFVVATRIALMASPSRDTKTLPAHELVTAPNLLPADLNIAPASVDDAPIIFFEVALIVVPVIVAADPLMDFPVAFLVVADSVLDEAETAFFVALEMTAVNACVIELIARLVSFATVAMQVCAVAANLFVVALLMLPATVPMTAITTFFVDLDTEPAIDDVEAFTVRLVRLTVEPAIDDIAAVKIASMTSPRR